MTAALYSLYQYLFHLFQKHKKSDQQLFSIKINPTRIGGWPVGVVGLGEGKKRYQHPTNKHTRFKLVELFSIRIYSSITLRSNMHCSMINSCNFLSSNYSTINGRIMKMSFLLSMQCSKNNLYNSFVKLKQFN